MALMIKYDEIIINDTGYFLKQTYRNRAEILSANGILRISIPVRKDKKSMLKDIKIDNSHKWRKDHWGAIQSCYGKSPYFYYYSNQLKQAIFEDDELLVDYLIRLLSICLISLGFNKKIKFASQTDLKSHFHDATDIISPKTDFEKNTGFKQIKYSQIFGSEFVTNLSVIDLLFCEGPNCLNVLKQSNRR